MADVQPMVAAALAGLPATWTADGMQPDEGALAAWMQQQLDTSGGLLMFRRSADPFDRALAYLKAEGVDVDRELAAIGRAHEADQHRARAAADRATDVALDLKAAEKRLLFEARGYNEGCLGFDRASLAEAEARVARLTAELTAACVDDPQLARSVRRSVA